MSESLVCCKVFVSAGAGNRSPTLSDLATSFPNETSTSLYLMVRRKGTKAANGLLANTAQAMTAIGHASDFTSSETKVSRSTLPPTFRNCREISGCWIMRLILIRKQVKHRNGLSRPIVQPTIPPTAGAFMANEEHLRILLRCMLPVWRT
jgi:hypothetical protein